MKTVNAMIAVVSKTEEVEEFMTNKISSDSLMFKFKQWNEKKIFLDIGKKRKKNAKRNVQRNVLA